MYTCNTYRLVAEISTKLIILRNFPLVIIPRWHQYFCYLITNKYKFRKPGRNKHSPPSSGDKFSLVIKQLA